MSRVLRIYCCYAQEDQGHYLELEKRLEVPRRQGEIDLWAASRVLAGEEAATRMQQESERAAVMLVLVSADLLASQQCWDLIETALRRGQRVVPVLVRPAEWQESGLGALDPLPADGVPVSQRDADEAWLLVVQGLRRLWTHATAPAQGPSSTALRLTSGPVVLVLGAVLSVLLRLKPLPAPCHWAFLGGALVVLGGLWMWQIRRAQRRHETPRHGGRVEMPTRDDLIARSRELLLIGQADFERAVDATLSIQQVPQLIRAQHVPHVGARIPGEARLMNEPLLDYVLRVRKLLLVGEPGAGKTQTLRTLCQDLLDWARDDPHFPVPFLINLSTFSQYPGSLRDWLAQGLKEGAEIEVAIGEALLQEGKLFLLLDGFDEMAAERRSQALLELNELLRGDPALGRCVVCSRTLEYREAGGKLTLPAALELLPLTPEQMQQAIAQAGPAAAPLAAALVRDPPLAGLLQTPLLLAIAVRTYAGASDLMLTGQTTAERCLALYDAYVAQMLIRSRAQAAHSTEETLRWLRWLAAYLRRDRQESLFLIERLQPTVLPAQRAYKLVRELANDMVETILVTLLCALAAGPAVGLILGLGKGGILAPFWGLVAGLVTGLVAWLVMAPIAALGLGLGLGLLLLVFDLIERLAPWPAGNPVRPRIIPMERLAWSWVRARADWARIAQGGLIYAVLFGVIAGLIRRVVVFGVGFGLVFGLAGGLMACFTDGWAVALNKGTVYPNQGIWSSALNGIMKVAVGLAFIGGLGLILGLAGALIGGLSREASLGVYFGLAAGLFFGLAKDSERHRSGLGEAVAHYVLRYFLWRGRHLPLRLVPWLEGCRARLLLRRDGGGYRFWHETLRDYFSELDDSRLMALVERIEPAALSGQRY